MLTNDLVQADAWVLGSYRKLDALDVPAFHGNGIAQDYAPLYTSRTARLHHLDTMWPRTGQGFGAFVSGLPMEPLSPGAALQIVLRFLASPLRYEPLNSFELHRAVASTRGLFPIRFDVVLRDEDGHPARYTYHPEHHALEAIEFHGAPPTLPEHCGMAIIGIGQYWMLAGKYAEFAPYAVVLEAGMLAAQLDHLCRLVGWTVNPITLDGGAWREALGLDDLETALVGVAIIGQPSDLVHGNVASVEVATRRRAANIAERFQKLPSLAALFDPSLSGIEPPRVQPNRAVLPQTATALHGSLGDVSERDMLSILGERSSGNDAVGFSPIVRATDMSGFKTFTSVSRTLGRLRHAMPGEEALSVTVAWLNPEHEPIGLYDLDGKPLHGQADPRAFVRSLEASLPHKLFRFNMAALTYVFFISADVSAGQAAHQDYALRRLHLAAGAVAQDISVALTAFGMFARPVRMLKELDLANSWQMDDFPLYQVLAGYNRSANWAMELM